MHLQKSKFKLPTSAVETATEIAEKTVKIKEIQQPPLKKNRKHQNNELKTPASMVEKK